MIKSETNMDSNEDNQSGCLTIGLNNSQQEVIVDNQQQIDSLIKQLENERNERHKLQELCDFLVKQNDNKVDENVMTVDKEAEVLNKNYMIETESLGAQVKQKEALEIKLKTVIQKLKYKLNKSEQLVKELTQKEGNCQMKINDNENHFNDDHLKKQNEIDSQIIELKKQLEEKETEIFNLKQKDNKVIENVINVEQVMTSEKETELTTKIDELENELQELKRVHSESEMKLSESEYELDIMKRNYTIEMECFGAQVQERETLIERLQTRNQKIKQKLTKSEELAKELTEKEESFKSKIDECEGLIKYEQMKSQNETDSRIFDLQKQLQEKENLFETELLKLKTQNTKLIALEDELRQRNAELEMKFNSNNFEIEINNCRKQIDSLINQLEAERSQKIQFQDLYQSVANHTDDGHSADQVNQLLAQLESEKQLHLAQKQELELRCKKFAAKFKVKEREVNSLEEKLRIAKENASKNVNEEQLIDSDKRIEELVKRVDELQFTASNLDSALQTERQKRRELESEKSQFWGQTPSLANRNSDSITINSDTQSSFSLLIDEGMADKSGLSSAKRFISKQRHYLMKGPTSAKYKRIAIIVYLVVIHVLFVKMCLF